MSKAIFYLAAFLFFTGVCNAQSKSFSDPAQMYNRLLVEKNNSFVRIGNYKVKGTPYLYGGEQLGKLFIHRENVAFAYLSYNTYEQTLEYNTSKGEKQPILKPTGTVDSFIILKNSELQLSDDMLFVNGKDIYASDNSFYQRVFKGSRFILFKKYKSELGIVSTNYIEAELRQFDLTYEYFYLDTTVNKLKKIKPALNVLKKEFKEEMDNISIITEDDLRYDQENALIKLFQFLN